MLRTRLCEQLGIDLPIFGAGTGAIATTRLAAAITNAGGFGMIGVGADPTSRVLERIRELRGLTRGPVGVNVILEVHPPEAIEAILAEGVDVLATGFGEAGPWVERAHAVGALLFHRCETPAEARAAVTAGADVVVAQGSDSGGHTGIVPTFALVPQVVDAAGGIPVLAAGGIADGRGLVAVLALGAAGALIGTRFVASAESAAHELYKRGIVAATATDSLETDIFEIGWPGRPERALRNSTTAAWEREAEPRVRPSARPVEMIARRGDFEIPRFSVDTPFEGDEGDVEAMAMYAGAAAGLVHEVLPAAEIVRRVAAEAEAVLAALAKLRS